MSKIRFTKLIFIPRLSLSDNVLIVITLIFIIILFRPIFNLALFGDDWLALHRYLTYLGPNATGQWNHFNYFFTSYGPQDIFFGILYRLFGLHSTYFYLTSFSLKILAGLSLAYLTYYLTKSKLSSYLAFTFFIVTPVGFEATDWVFNMPSFVSIIFLCLFLIFFLKSHFQDKHPINIMSIILFYLAFVSQPIRMHGIIIFVIIFESFWLLNNFKYTNLLISLKRTLIYMIVFTFIFFIGLINSPVPAFNNILTGINIFTSSIKNGRFDFFFYPLVTLGSLVIPEVIIIANYQVTSFGTYLRQILLPVYLAFVIVLLIVMTCTMKGYKKYYYLAITFALLWSICLYFIFQSNPTTFSNINYIFSGLVGGYFLIGVVSFIVSFRLNPKIYLIFTSGLILALSFFLFPWLQSPTSIFLTSHRYLVISAVGISLLLSVMTFLAQGVRKQIVFGVAILLISLHIKATQTYLSQAEARHNKQISQKIWQSIPHIPEVGKSKEPIVFYFEGDGTNGSILHNVITFGFPPHMALIYNLREGEGIPVPMTDWKEVVSAVSDGKAFFAYGYPLKPIPDERIYAFKLYDKDNLVNITHEVREKLRSE